MYGAYDGYRPLAVAIVNFFGRGSPRSASKRRSRIYAFMRGVRQRANRVQRPEVTLASVLTKAHTAAEQRLRQLQ